MENKLTIYNTLSRKKELFEPINPPFVGLYVCGPTVYVDSLFGTINSVDGVEVETLFDENDVTGYAAYPVADCPLCRQGQKIEAMVNGFGYSKL